MGVAHSSCPMRRIYSHPHWRHSYLTPTPSFHPKIPDASVFLEASLLKREFFNEVFHFALPCYYTEKIYAPLRGVLTSQIQYILFSKNGRIVSFFSKRWKSEVAVQYVYQFYIISCKKKNGYNLRIESRRAIPVGPYFASKSPGHDVTLTSFAPNIWKVRFFCT